jgi:NADH-quinone oxidoreductase subunit N
MYFDEPAKAFDRPGSAARIVLALSTAVVIFYAFAPAPLTDAAMAAAKSLF